MEGASVYTTSDLVSVTSDIGEQAKIDIVDVGSGSVQEKNSLTFRWIRCQ